MICPHEDTVRPIYRIDAGRGPTLGGGQQIMLPLYGANIPCWSPLSPAFCSRDPGSTLPSSYKWIRCNFGRDFKGVFKEEVFRVFWVGKKRCFVSCFFFFLSSVTRFGVCSVWTVAKQMAYYFPQSFKMIAGLAGVVMESQCISSAGFSRLHQDLSYPLQLKWNQSQQALLWGRPFACQTEQELSFSVPELYIIQLCVCVCLCAPLSTCIQVTLVLVKCVV